MTTQDTIKQHKYREIATILAGLRILQANPEFAEEMSHFVDCEPLTDDEIDVLCEEINMGTWQPWAAPEGGNF